MYFGAFKCLAPPNEQKHRENYYHWCYLSSEMFEVICVADASQFTVWLSIRIQTLHNELGYLNRTHTHTHTHTHIKTPHLHPINSLCQSFCVFAFPFQPREPTSLRNVSLLFLASSLEVSASAVFVENCHKTHKGTFVFFPSKRPHFK